MKINPTSEKIKSKQNISMKKKILLYVYLHTFDS